MDERRERIRIPCKLEVKSGEESQWFILYSKNIGTSGILLSCETDLDKLEKIGIAPEKEIILHFCPPEQGYTAKVPSKIIRVERKDSTVHGRMSHVEVHFSELPEDVKKSIEGFVKEQQKTKP